MYRTSSTTRFSDEFFNSSTTQSASADAEQLPSYDPLSHVAKKERIRIRSAENAIHAIPLVLLLCAIILWFFSNPGEVKRKENIIAFILCCCCLFDTAVDIVNKGSSIVARPKDLMVNGNMEGGVEQSRLLKDLEDSDLKKELLHQKSPKSSENES